MAPWDKTVAAAAPATCQPSPATNHRSRATLAREDTTTA